MRIVDIFDEKLFAFHYEGEEENEYDRLMDLWNDVAYLYQFLKENESDISQKKAIDQVAEEIIEDSYLIDDKLISIVESTDKTLSHFFTPLHNQEYQTKVLSLQKGRQHYLRMYAIRVDDDTFIITGGAIKLTHLMEERQHTLNELTKIKAAKDFLSAEGIIDQDSFFEFLNE